MLNSIFIFFLHVLPASNWTYDIERGVITELQSSGVAVRSKTYHIPETTIAEIIKKIKKQKPSIVVLSNDLPESQKVLPYEIRKHGIPVFFVGKKKRFSVKNKINFAGIYGRQNYTGSIRAVEKIMNKKIHKIGVVSSPHPLIKQLVKNLKEDALKLNNKISIREIQAKTFEEYKEALKILIDKDEVDLLLPYIPYGGMYKSQKTSPHHWAMYAKAITAANVRTPTIGGGSLKNSTFPVLAAFALNPKKLGKQSASQIYRFLKGESPKSIGFEEPLFYNLEINMRELRRLKKTLPDEMFSYSEILNNDENKLDDFRSKFKTIDEAIFSLLRQRQEVSVEIAEYKKSHGLRVIDGKHMQVVIENKIRKAKEIGIPEEYAEELSHLMVRYSKIIQLERVFEEDTSHLKKNPEKQAESFLGSIKKIITSFFCEDKIEGITK